MVLIGSAANPKMDNNASSIAKIPDLRTSLSQSSAAMANASANCGKNSPDAENQYGINVYWNITIRIPSRYTAIVPTTIFATSFRFCKHSNSFHT